MRSAIIIGFEVAPLAPRARLRCTRSGSIESSQSFVPDAMRERRGLVIAVLHRSQGSGIRRQEPGIKGQHTVLSTRYRSSANEIYTQTVACRPLAPDSCSWRLYVLFAKPYRLGDWRRARDR